MPQNQSQLGAAVTNLAEALLIEVPLLAVGSLFNRRFGRDLGQAGWKAYDAGVTITTELTNRVYASPRVARISSRAMDNWLNLQRFSSAATGAFFAALWPVVGLPTAAEMQQLIDQVESVREQLQANDAAFGAHADIAPEVPGFSISPTLDSLAGEVRRHVAH